MKANLSWDVQLHAEKLEVENSETTLLKHALLALMLECVLMTSSI